MQRLIAPLALAALAALSTAPVLAQGTVHVVDSLGGVGAAFADIQPAVDAAVDGDTILIRPGIYTGFTVDGKDLDLFGDVDASTSAKVLTGRCAIRNIPAGKQVTLSDMRLTPGLEVTDALGPVLLQGLVFGDTFVGGAEPTDKDGLEIRSSDEVVLGRSYVSGYVANGGMAAAMDGPVAMRVVDSTVYAWDTDITGGSGADGSFSSTFLTPGKGGTGLVVVNATVRGDDLVVSGGRGGRGIVGISCTSGGVGGIGLEQTGPSSLIELRSSSIVPGQGGEPGGPTCSSGPWGVATSLTGGQLSQLVGEKRRYAVPFVAREGDTMPLVVEGGSTASGAVALWLLADGTSSLPLGLAEGVLISSAPVHVSVLGVAGPTGGLLAWRTIPDLGPGVQALTVVSQAALLTAAGELRLTEPEATLLLDGSF